MSSFVFQLRYLQTLASISQENNSTIVFPIPIDIIADMVKGQQRYFPVLLPEHFLRLVMML